MAAVIYGNSPRHHNRIMVTSSNGNIQSDQQFHAQMLSTAPSQSSTPTALVTHRSHPPSPSNYHHVAMPSLSRQQYATFQTTSIISQKIYVPAPMPSQFTGLPAPPLPIKNPIQYHSLPASISIQQQMTPPQLPQKTRSRFFPSPPNGIPNDGTTIAHARLVKRKTAVELLAESKPYYVKSELVLDRQNRCSAGERTMKSSLSELSSLPSLSRCTGDHGHHLSQTLPHQRTSSHQPSRRSGPTDSDLLQTKLRRLLNDGNVGGNRIESHQQSSINTNRDNNNKNSGYFYERPINEPPTTKTSSCSKPKTLPKLLSPQRHTQELTIQSISDQNSDNLLIYPSAFLSPQSLPTQNFLSDDDSPCYDYCDNDDSLILTADYQTISPPAEYAESNKQSYGDYKRESTSRHSYYQRSSSHCQEIDSDAQAMSRNSHKSLPDLHTQSNRNSPHSDAMSYRSRGNRSSKSGSSLNRDSGESSGHYTHHSESYGGRDSYVQQRQLPSPPQISKLMDYRRDSGSSTQHSENLYRHNCTGCSNGKQCGDDCLLNFTTSEVPDAFKDDYVCDNVRSSSQCSPKKQYHLRYDHSPDEPTQIVRKDSGDTDVSPPLGTFRRQKCLRLKQHPSRYSSSDRAHTSSDDRRPILRSKSDISHRYWQRNRNEPNEPKLSIAKHDIDMAANNSSNELQQLERFFDNLGLDDRKYDECIVGDAMIDDESSRSSPTFFSDVSTVDSMRLLDSTETQATIAPYRPIETTSIVERNARIIKWLCACRKLQMAASS